MFRSEPTLAPGLLHPQEEPAGQHLANLAGQFGRGTSHPIIPGWCPFKVLLRPRFSYVLGELWYWRSSIFACRCPCPDPYPKLLLGSTWVLGPPLSIPIPYCKRFEVCFWEVPNVETGNADWNPVLDVLGDLRTHLSKAGQTYRHVPLHVQQCPPGRCNDWAWSNCQKIKDSKS